MNRQAEFENFFNTHPQKQLVHGDLSWTYMVGGGGRSVLLYLPGAMNSAATGFEHVSLLEKDFRVVFPSYPSGARTMRELVEGVRAILDAERIPEAHIAGSSFGGAIAQCFIRAYPERSGKMILSSGDVPDAARADRSERMLVRLRWLPTSVLRYFMKLGMRKASARFEPEDREFWAKSVIEAIGQLRRESFLNFYKRSIDFDRNYKFTATDVADASTRIQLLDDDEMNPSDFVNAVRRFLL